MRSLRPVDGAVFGYAVAAVWMIVMARGRLEHPWAAAGAHAAVVVFVAAVASLQERRGGTALTALRAWDAVIYLPVLILLAREEGPRINPVDLSTEVQRVEAWIGGAAVMEILRREVGPGVQAIVLLGSYGGVAALALMALGLFERDRPAFWRLKTAVVLVLLLALVAALAIPTGEGGAPFLPLRGVAAALAVGVAAQGSIGRRGWWIGLGLLAAACTLILGTWGVPGGTGLLGLLVVVFIAAAATLLAWAWETPPAGESAAGSAPGSAQAMRAEPLGPEPGAAVQHEASLDAAAEGGTAREADAREVAVGSQSPSDPQGAQVPELAPPQVEEAGTSPASREPATGDAEVGGGGTPVVVAESGGPVEPPSAPPVQPEERTASQAPARREPRAGLV